ncbi:MAG: chemotaxis-specific protein-glutamate methyltransferase CheB [Bdellovibrio sp.]
MNAVNNESPEVVSSAIGKVSKLVSQLTGIQLGDKQYSMVENRLKTRMVRLNIDTFSAYMTYLDKNQEEESQALVSLMTTHHTYFFREFSHFEFLINTGLDVLVRMARERKDKKIRIWSAACSRGHEVYSLAMFFYKHLQLIAPDVDFEIFGSDVDPDSVAYAKNGVYRNEELDKSPSIYIDGNVVHGKDSATGFSKIKKHLTDRCKIQTVNLFDANKFLSDKKFDIVFCRNVFIYFDQSQIRSITNTILSHLQPAGFLVLGVSESLNGLGLPVKLIHASIFCHQNCDKKLIETEQASVTQKPRNYNVLCVDDSDTILKLLKNILVEAEGFKVTATAKNGQEALNLLAKEKFDVVTLDLHMPQMDGIEFLRKGGGKNIPVVVVSAVSRENENDAKMAITLGAKDYVEKPSMQNLDNSGNEIRSKLKMVLKSSQMGKSEKNNVKELTSLPSTGPNTRTSTSTNPTRKQTPDQPTLSVVSSSQNPRQKIKTLIVDDSLTIRQVMQTLLSKDPDFEIVGLAEKPSEVEPLIKKFNPDLITLDIHMPEMDGLTLLKKIHPVYKIPTVMISSISASEGPIVLQSLESGAVDYIEKPSMKDLGSQADMIRDRLKVAARANIKRIHKQGSKVHSSSALNFKSSLIVIGASTGGTEALRVVLESMPNQIPPILIVQHIPAHFSKTFADRLNQLLPFEVREAKDNDEVKENQVLIAPGSTQMKFVNDGGVWKVRVTDDVPVNRHKPSVDYLFNSVSQANIKNVVAVILTGMGADGAVGMKTLKNQGARTIAQDKDSCVVFGMPREAIEKGGVEKVLPLEKVAEGIFSFFKTNTNKEKAG